jgi:hypothetical protein
VTRSVAPGAESLEFRAKSTMVELQNAALVVHPGTQHAPSLAAQLQRRGMLGRYWTGFAIRDEGLMGRVVGALSSGLRGRLSTGGARVAGQARLRFLRRFGRYPVSWRVVATGHASAQCRLSVVVLTWN